MTTKDQERKALEKIRKIVEELGEGSYIGMAFEGCFEIAEENIENDFGCSWKQRAERAEHDSKVLQNAADTCKAERDEARKEVDDLKKRTLTGEDLHRIANLVTAKRISLKETMERAAKQIVDNAEHPAGHDFKNAVEDHREAKALMETYKGLSERINGAIEA